MVAGALQCFCGGVADGLLGLAQALVVDHVLKCLHFLFYIGNLQAHQGAPLAGQILQHVVDRQLLAQKPVGGLQTALFGFQHCLTCGFLRTVGLALQHPQLLGDGLAARLVGSYLCLGAFRSGLGGDQVAVDGSQLVLPVEHGGDLFGQPGFQYFQALVLDIVADRLDSARLNAVRALAYASGFLGSVLELLLQLGLLLFRRSGFLQEIDGVLIELLQLLFFRVRHAAGGKRFELRLRGVQGLFQFARCQGGAGEQQLHKQGDDEQRTGARQHGCLSDRQYEPGSSVILLRVLGKADTEKAARGRPFLMRAV